MNRCIAVRRQGTTEPCPAMALRGHQLCGRHARMSQPTLWIDANCDAVAPITKIQACVRGWLVRRRLSYAGFGVLARGCMTNDEDIISYAEKNRVHPMDFFSFDDNGKFWWFTFDSLWTWCMRSEVPVNPYTKTPLSTEARKRLRTIWGYKRRHCEPLPEEPTDYHERLHYRVNLLIQHFADYGFVGVPPQMFLRFSKPDYITMFVLLQRDVETVISEKDPFQRRIRLLCTNRTSVQTSLQNNHYVLQCAGLLLYMLSLYRDPYVLTFSVLSAAYRV